MTQKKKDAILGWSIPITWLTMTAIAKGCLFPERSFFELIITGFFPNAIVCGVVLWILSSIIKVDEK